MRIRPVSNSGFTIQPPDDNDPSLTFLIGVLVIAGLIVCLTGSTSGLSDLAALLLSAAVAVSRLAGTR